MRDLLHDRLEAEGAAFIGDDGDHELADVLVLEQGAHDADEPGRGGEGAAFGAGEELLEEVERGRLEAGLRHGAGGHVATQCLAAGLHVSDGWVVRVGAVEVRIPSCGFGQRDVELRDEGGEAFVGELLFRVGGVAGLRGGEAVALDGLGEDDGGATLVLEGALVGVVDLDGVVAAAVQPGELLVGLILHQFQQFGVFPEELLAQIGAALGLEGLEVAVDALFHALEEQTLVIAGEEFIPIGAPDDLDDVPGGAAEHAFQFVDDPLVAADGPVEALEVAVDDEDEVVEAFARGERDGAEGVDFVGFAVADEGPDLALGVRDQVAVLEVLHEAGLVDGVERADAHGDGGELPEVAHQPGVRVAGERGLAAEFVAEVLEAGLVEAAFEEGAGVDAGRGVALEVDEVAGLVAAGRGVYLAWKKWLKPTSSSVAREE